MYRQQQQGFAAPPGYHGAPAHSFQQHQQPQMIANNASRMPPMYALPQQQQQQMPNTHKGHSSTMMAPPPLVLAPQPQQQYHQYQQAASSSSSRGGMMYSQHQLQAVGAARNNSYVNGSNNASSIGTAAPPTYYGNNNKNASHAHAHALVGPPRYSSNDSANAANVSFPSVGNGAMVASSAANASTPSVSVVPFVVPALTPALQSNMAVIKPSHQVLLVRPLPAFLTEDEDLLALAKSFVLPEGFEDKQAEETRRILAEGDNVVLEKIAEVRKQNTVASSTSFSTVSQMKKKNPVAAVQHFNYLPFAAKVIRKSVLSAVTTAFHVRRAAEANAMSNETTITDAFTAAVADATAATTAAEVLSNNKCFCEEGYGFLLFATEEAGLTYLRAVEHLAIAERRKGVEGASTEETISTTNTDRPANVASVRTDFNEISAIKARVYEDANDEDDEDENQGDALVKRTASYSSSCSSSSFDSATSFDSNSSFASVASEIAEEEDTPNANDAINNKSAIHATCHPLAAAATTILRSCDECARHRRMYRIYYRAKMNRQQVDAVSVRCAVVVKENSNTEASDSNNTNTTINAAATTSARRPALFNGVPTASKEHIAEMRSLFANCFFNTTILVAGGDGTVAAKSRVKAVPLMGAAAALSSSSMAVGAQTEASMVSSLAAVPPATNAKPVAIHKPVIIDCNGRDVSFMRMSNINTIAPVTSYFTMQTPSDDLPRLTAELLKQHSTALSAALGNGIDGVQVSTSSIHNKHHHTHHRHCCAHRPIAIAKRVEVRRTKTMQAKLCSRARQAPHVVNIAVPIAIPMSSVTATTTLAMAPVEVSTPAVAAPPAYCAPQQVQPAAPTPMHAASMAASSSTTSAPTPYMAIAHSRANSYEYEANSATSYSGLPTNTQQMRQCSAANGSARVPSYYSTTSMDMDVSSSVACESPIPQQEVPAATVSTNNGVVASAKSSSVTTTTTTVDGQKRFRYNPYGMQQKMEATHSSAAATASHAASAEKVAVLARPPVVAVVAKPSAETDNHNTNANNGGFASFLPWAGAAGGLQEVANNAGARFKNMLHMTKTKRF